MSPPPMHVLRVYHSGVVGAWRQRDRELASLGVDCRLVSSARWNEGGATVDLDAKPSEQVIGARTWGRHPFVFLYAPVALWRALRSAPIDVLDIHEEPASLAAFEVYVLSRVARRRAPFCLYSAQNIDKDYPPPFRWVERFLLRRAGAVHSCNEQVGWVLRRKGFSGRVCNLGLGVDIERFTEPSSSSGEPAARGSSGGLRLGYVGRFERHKGVNVLLDAVAKVGDCTLELVGAGPEEEGLRASVVRLGLADRVRISGYVPNDELPSVYQRFDVVVIPSLTTPTWIEQFGRVAVEAMAAGIPVIASDSGSLPEVIGDAGVLVAQDDPIALAEAIEGLRDTDRRRRLRRAGIVRSRRHAWSTIAQRQLDLYHQMIEDADG